MKGALDISCRISRKPHKIKPTPTSGDRLDYLIVNTVLAIERDPNLGAPENVVGLSHALPNPVSPQLQNHLQYDSEITDFSYLSLSYTTDATSAIESGFTHGSLETSSVNRSEALTDVTNFDQAPTTSTSAAAASSNTGETNQQGNLQLNVLKDGNVSSKGLKEKKAKRVRQKKRYKMSSFDKPNPASTAWISQNTTKIEKYARALTQKDDMSLGRLPVPWL